MSEQDDDLKARVEGMGAACFALQARKTANLAARVYNQAVADLGLEMSQCSTLFLIAAERDESVSEAAALLGVDRSTLVRNLALLERDKLIARDHGDGGGIRYRLTPRGRALVKQALPRWAALQDGIELELASASGGDPRPAMRNLRRAIKTAGSQRASA